MKNKKDDAKELVVFVALRGELNESSWIISIHGNEKKAIKAALREPRCFPGRWKKEEKERNCWVNGCDFVSVTKYVVKP